MALINCPECKREISDKVKACPHCGYPLIEETTPKTKVLPQEVEVTGVKINDANLKRNIIIGIAVIAFAIIGFIGYKLISEQQAKIAYEIAFNSYIDNLELARTMMLAGGSDAEDQVNLTASVWRNAIYQDSDPATNKYVKPQGIYVSDFNIALKNLYADPTIITKISNIKDNQTTVRDLMKGFQNPPKGLEACYITVTDLYTAYSSLTDMAVNPSGSLTSFTADKSTKVNAFMDAYKKLETQIPDKIGNK